jgi:hypothetical protein
MASSGMLRRVALVRTNVSEELGASIIRVTRIDELGTVLAVDSYKNHVAQHPRRWHSSQGFVCIDVWEKI